MKIFREIIYPCGLKITESYNDDVLIKIGSSKTLNFSTNINLCPVHGTDCKKEV